jgi:RHS repeat-associated protein
VQVAYFQPDLRSDLAHGSGSDPYDSLDRFGRLTDLLWRDYGSSSDAVRIKPGYDRAGNMTAIPKPADPTSAYTATYDAWNRLVKLQEDSSTVAEYAYDGAKRRTVKKTYSGGVLSETRHFYYTQPEKWQVLEERVGFSTSAQRQFVWGLRYVDDLVLRHRDTEGNGALEERFYALQDANWNVAAIAAPTGIVQERFAYDAYGTPTVLTLTFANRSSSSFAWEILYAGYRWDSEARCYQVRNCILIPGFGWIQRDPIGGMNLYEYALDNPLVHTDPSGYIAVCCRRMQTSSMADCFIGDITEI